MKIGVVLLLDVPDGCVVSSYATAWQKAINGEPAATHPILNNVSITVERVWTCDPPERLVAAIQDIF